MGSWIDSLALESIRTEQETQNVRGTRHWGIGSRTQLTGLLVPHRTTIQESQPAHPARVHQRSTELWIASHWILNHRKRDFSFGVGSHACFSLALTIFYNLIQHPWIGRYTGLWGLGSLDQLTGLPVYPSTNGVGFLTDSPTQNSTALQQQIILLYSALDLTDSGVGSHQFFSLARFHAIQLEQQFNSDSSDFHFLPFSLESSFSLCRTRTLWQAEIGQIDTQEVRDSNCLYRYFAFSLQTIFRGEDTNTCCTETHHICDPFFIHLEHGRADKNLSAFPTSPFREWCKPGPNPRNKLQSFDHIGSSRHPDLFAEFVRSEGCSWTMTTAGVSDDWTPQHLLQHDTKAHGTRPEARPDILAWFPAQKPVVKRSIKRAFARSMRDGVSWYRGKCLTPNDFPKTLHANYKPSILPDPMHESKTLMQCNRTHQDARRFRLVQWNAGGLALHRLDALKVWMINQHIDIMVVAETRWTYENEWADDNFLFVHTGHQSHVGMGILCIMSRKLCRPDQLKWRVVQPGRLIHIQIQHTSRSIDIVGCYQYTHANTATRMQERAQWWRMLDDLLHGLAHRNVLALTGDFNCNLPQADSHCGTGSYRWGHQLTQGATHSDQGLFMSRLRMHGLTALNSWSSSLGPTYIHATSHSRIDFIITRKSAADGLAKAVGYAWDAPFCTDAKQGHAPIITQLRKSWFSHAHRTYGISAQQRRTGHLAYQVKSPNWQDFVADLTQQLYSSMMQAWTSDEQFIPILHDTAITCYQKHFPSMKRPCSAHDPDTETLVMNKWTHRKQLLQLRRTDVANCFKAWFHMIRFQQLNRQSKKQAKAVRQRRFQELIAEAQIAANHHRSHELFSIINRYSPRQPKRRIQLRNARGHIATPIEERSILNQFVLETWRGPQTFPVVTHQHAGMPFTIAELTRELRRIPAVKAVARPCAPGAVWKCLATTLAPSIHAKLQEWWSRPTPFLPTWFRDCWMVLIPKPNKPPVHPKALRPLALQEPISKCLVGLLTRSALRDAYPNFVQVPLWAYLPGRSTQDALMRVAQHCREAKALMQTLRSTPFTRHRGHKSLPLAGGLQLFLDIERAFDTVSRERLFQRLHLTGIHPQTVQLLAL